MRETVQKAIENWMRVQFERYGKVQFRAEEIRAGINSHPSGQVNFSRTQVRNALTRMLPSGKVMILDKITGSRGGRPENVWGLVWAIEKATKANETETKADTQNIPSVVSSRNDPSNIPAPRPSPSMMAKTMAKTRSAAPAPRSEALPVKTIDDAAAKVQSLFEESLERNSEALAKKLEANISAMGASIEEQIFETNGRQQEALEIWSTHVGNRLDQLIGAIADANRARHDGFREGVLFAIENRLTVMPEEK